MQCPKCGFAVSAAEAVECPKCGVVLAKASRDVAPPPRSAAPPRPSSSTVPRVIAVAIFIVVAMFVWHSFGGGQSSAQAGTWYHGADGYEQALAQQKSNGQPILLYFHTEWCGYCKRLERDVLSTPAFEQRYRSLLKVKVNPESSSTEHKLAKDYGIRGFPTLFIVTAGTPGDPIVGYGGADNFYARLQQAARN